MNNASFLTADIATHVKVVAIALAAATIATLVEFGVHTRSEGSDPHIPASGQTVAPGN